MNLQNNEFIGLVILMIFFIIVFFTVLIFFGEILINTIKTSLKKRRFERNKKKNVY